MRRIILLAAAAIAVSGCATTDTGVSTGVAALPASGQPVPAVALEGGLVERAGVSLSPADRAKALQAEQYALASVPAGETVSWQGRDAEGKVTAASPYQVGDQNCRQYTQRVSVKGQEYVGRGAACRGEDGLWTLLN
ncbi:hypothetical protein [Martelella lutilitoris]|uniref:hypothetical protein n=1 Tax=Martelella lutilitoris TaxID=2583532 RepID=UPI001FE85042|nr:hypothetical protein [Martelella lutilitoris]